MNPSNGGVVRVRMTVAYDGGGFRGFAANAGVTTVAGTLGAALGRVLGQQVVLTCAGRTDAGVHAWGQVVTFDVGVDVGVDVGAGGGLDDGGGRLDLVALQRSVNRQCAPRIVVRDAKVVDASFDARWSARARRYRYTILNRPIPDLFLAATTWWVERPLDLAAMRLAADPLIGEHDFAAFCRRPKPGPGLAPPSLVRRVIDARWHDLGAGVLRFDIEASSFCHQMVRSVVGTLVGAGAGRRRAGEMRGIMASGDRAQAAQLAPPHGLCLWEVHYG